MTKDQFYYWLQGFFDSNPTLTPKGWETIKMKLDSVYESQTWGPISYPNQINPTPAPFIPYCGQPESWPPPGTVFCGAQSGTISSQTRL